MKILKNVMAHLASLVAIISLAIPLMVPVAVNAQTASGLCYVFTQNLGEGRSLSSQDAAALTQALTNAGVWSGGAITTYNDAVASAVSGFQEKYASQILTPNGLSYGTGFVGASTRNELNSIYGGCGSPSNSTQPTQCPAGFTCTPIGQAPVCPTGYTCTPVTTNPTIPTIPSTQAVPTISSVQSPAESPNILHPGEWANVYGTNLQNGVTVVVAGQSVSVDNPYTSSLRFTIPSSLPAGTATLYVTNSAGTSNSISVTISTPSTPSAPAPTITRISAPASPDSQVYAGEKFAIQGTNFVMPDSVYVGNESATVTQDGNWQTGGVLYATAPNDLQSGSSYVTVVNVNGTSNQYPVTVTSSVSSTAQSPTITRISAPASADSEVYAGSKFAIQGTNFVVPDSVYVGNEAATVTQDGNWPTGGVLYAIAPSDLYSGSNYVYIKNANGTSNQIPVTVVGQTATTIQPVITSLSPSSGPIGTRVTLYGNNFIPASGSNLIGQASVYLTGKAYGETVQASSVSPSSLSFVIPSDANPAGVYNMQVTNITGSGMSSQVQATSNTVNFTVTSQ